MPVLREESLGKLVAHSSFFGFVILGAFRLWNRVHHDVLCADIYAARLFVGDTGSAQARREQVWKDIVGWCFFVVMMLMCVCVYVCLFVCVVAQLLELVGVALGAVARAGRVGYGRCVLSMSRLALTDAFCP